MRLHAVIWLFSGVHLMGLHAYPTINIPFLFGPSSYGEGASRFKKSGLESETDADVVELEHLKDHLDNENADAKVLVSQQQEAPFESNAGESQELERQLEQMPALTTKLEKSTTTELPSAVVPENRAAENQMPVEGAGIHRPPTLQHDNGGKAVAGNSVAGQQQSAETSAKSNGGGGIPPAPSVSKPFYGAARLAFGQNPEVLPTTTTTSSTSASTSTTTTTVATVKPNSEGQEANIDDADIHPADVEAIAASGQEALGTVPANKLAEQMKSMSQRRSLVLTPQQIAEAFLKRRNGQLSPFDMAQYVFWTGDEAGVARAVEELIERGMISRENALTFLHEVRVGIEYLQHSYTNRIYPEPGLNRNVEKKMFDFPQIKPMISPTIAPANEKPLLPYLRLERILHANKQNPTNSVENGSVWHKLQALNNDGRQDVNDYDEIGERAKISQFLYNEYTLEDILYKLAKIMFTQSLAHGSDEAQYELQKLTNFLEREGNLGIIPIDLQKKVLHILFRALSDTLAERPELLPMANVNLANPYNALSMHSFDP